MKHVFLAAVAALVVIVGAAGSAVAGGKPKPEPCVTLARSWDGAVEEAKLLNLPIVVHIHGFY
jgi:hypothetical protein